MSGMWVRRQTNITQDGRRDCKYHSMYKDLSVMGPTSVGGGDTAWHFMKIKIDPETNRTYLSHPTVAPENGLTATPVVGLCCSSAHLFFFEIEER